MLTLTPELTGAMQRIAALLGSGDLTGAHEALAAIVAAHPDYAEALRLLGVTRQALGDAAGAEPLLRQALALDPNWTPTLASLGELLIATGRGTEAESLLRRAASGSAPFPRAALVLARYLNDSGRPAEALAAATPLAVTGRADSELAAQHVRALVALGRGQEAVAGYRHMQQAAPGQAAAADALALALNLTGQHEEASRVADQTLASGHKSALLLNTYARSLIAQGVGLDRAETVLRECLALEPRLIDAHNTLAQLVWMRTGDLAKATATLDEVLARAPADASLLAAKAAILQGAGDARGAYECLAPLAAHSQAPPTLLVRAGLAALEFDPTTAVGLAERALRIMPGNTAARTLLAAARLGVGEPQAALAECATLLARDPDEQYLIALQTTAWRMQGDPRYERLCDYRNLVMPFQLRPPPGWADLASFLEEVRESLKRMHDPNGHALLFQSLRNGTETTQDLARSADPVIRALFQSFVSPIERYLRHIGQGPDPLRRRNSGRWRFNGAWSVRLHSSGFHANHVHPRGWISSACYLELPDSMRNRNSEEGVLTFAAPGLLTQPPLPAQHAVRPEPGMLVLFPSYFWHGTVPFRSEQARMTVAFDAVPAL
jgi:tetratricopeptide (TPR) repeat protein